MYAQRVMPRRYALIARTTEGKPYDNSAVVACFAVAAGKCVAAELNLYKLDMSADKSTIEQGELDRRADIHQATRKECRKQVLALRLLSHRCLLTIQEESLCPYSLQHCLATINAGATVSVAGRPGTDQDWA